ncbi:MAG TPA: ABC transporter permease [Verrucomicrobiae bacterium]|nr:ABC transporter permease [Verrucomicrobiae bacterium]
MASVRGVIGFEVFRNLRRKTFWFAAIAPPILILVIFGITHVSSQSASNAAQQQSNNLTKSSTIAVLDDTGVISKASLSKEHIMTETSKQAGITAVQRGSLTAFIYYPKDVTKAGIQVYGQDQGINNATPYNGLATALLVDSAKARAVAAVHNPQVVQILESAPNVTATTYKNGQQTNDEADIIAPGIFLIAFLALVVLQAYLMITSTTEEKENRTAEILLTSIKSQTLITGKILSLFILGVVQLLIIIVPLLIAYAIFRHHVSLPGGITLSQIPIDAKAVSFGVLFFVFGVVLFTGYLVGFGSLFPSAQEAGRYLGMSIIAAYLPIYAIGFIIDNTHSFIINVFTYFPLTAPTTILIRNAIGTISTGQALVSLVVVIVFAVLAILFAMKAFRYSAMEYGRRVSIKELFR